MSQENQSATPVLKLALSVNKEFDPFTITVDELIENDVFLAERPACETDVSAVQLIPYITLVDCSTKDIKFFVYTRGKASGEQRLAGKCSVGLGGHVEEIVGNKGVDNLVVTSVCNAAVRELEEEIGLTVPFSVFSNGMQKGYSPVIESNSNRLYFEKASILYNTITPTDVVHLGVSFIVKAKPSDIKNLELDIITRGRWMTYDQIEEAESGDNPMDLEIWSKTVIARVNMKQASEKSH